MLNRGLVGLLSLVLASSVAFAQTVALNPAHPDRYVVQKGDTLWDISGRFLEEPWRWPEVWKANPQIEDPHLIYPGDEIVLTTVGGAPVIEVRRNGRPTVKLSPMVRAEVLDTAIPTIPVDAIHQFLLRPRVVTEEELENAPYILSVGAEALLARPGGKFYARGIDDASSVRFTVYRRGQEYVAADGTVLGLEALHVGDAVLDVPGNPATLVLTGMQREVLTGDRLIPVRDEEIDHHFVPRPPGDNVAGQIIAVVDGVSQIGQHAVVVLDLGSRDGLEAGHVLDVMQRGAVVIDDQARDPDTATVEGREHLELDPERQGGFDGAVQSADDYFNTLWNSLRHEAKKFDVSTQSYQEVQLPDQHAGTLMVFRAFDRVSYALVLDASRAMHVNDTVRSPERRR